MRNRKCLDTKFSAKLRQRNIYNPIKKKKRLHSLILGPEQVRNVLARFIHTFEDFMFTSLTLFTFLLVEPPKTVIKV